MRRALRQAEIAAQSKDKDLTEALHKLVQYETGQYGLREAVKEIKALKNQVWKYRPSKLVVV